MPNKPNGKVTKKALGGFEPLISCLLDRHFNQLSHSATYHLTISKTRVTLNLATATEWNGKHHQPKKVLRELQPSISCLQDRHFNQPSHSTTHHQAISKTQVSLNIVKATEWNDKHHQEKNTNQQFLRNKSVTVLLEKTNGMKSTTSQKRHWRDLNPRSPVY